MRATAPALLALAVLLAGCQSDPEPADPPTSQDALTTTSDDAPTTQALPPDDVEATLSAPDDMSATTEAGGPPTLPDEAKEQSEAGAAAFATFYLDTLNYSTMNSTDGLLEDLGGPDCKTCRAFEELVTKYADEGHHSDGPVVTFQPLEARASGSNMIIFADAVQPVPSTLDESGNVVQEGAEGSAFTMVIRMHWSEGQWMITEIQAEA